MARKHGKRGGPSLLIQRPDVKPCPQCLPGHPGLYKGLLYECTCAYCHGIGVVTESGEPIPVTVAIDLLARLVISQRRFIYELQKPREEVGIGSPID